MTPLEIGLILLGALAGFLLAALVIQGRADRRTQEDAQRLRGVEKLVAARDTDLAGARTEAGTLRSEIESVRAESAQAAVKMEELAARLDESNASNVDLEDRLNAAEARLLSSEAIAEQGKLDTARWSTAYAQLKLQYARLSGEQVETLERQTRLEEELLARRGELEELVARLESLEAAQHLQLEVRSPDADTLRQSMAVVALARADAEVALRRRDLELTELRSELAAMRYSINILTSSAAELAAQVAGPLEERADFDVQLSRPAAERLPAATRAPDPTSEELADLHGIIRDWFGEIQESISYETATLLAFGGASNEDRFVQAPSTIDMNPDSSEAGPFVLPRRMADLPPSLLLAAIKASASTALEHSITRQFELAQDLARNRSALDRLAVQVNAWRSMLQVVVADDADVLRLLGELHDATTSEMLSACATVALTAYQKKQEALKRAHATLTAAQPLLLAPDSTGARLRH